MLHAVCGTIPEDTVCMRLERLPRGVPPATACVAFRSFALHNATADSAVEELRARLESALPCGGRGLALSCVLDGFVVAADGFVDECYLVDTGRLAGEIVHVRASTPFVAEHCFASIAPVFSDDLGPRPTTPPWASPP
jgi:hypothetical protein